MTVNNSRDPSRRPDGVATAGTGTDITALPGSTSGPGCHDSAVNNEPANIRTFAYWPTTTGAEDAATTRRPPSAEIATVAISPGCSWAPANTSRVNINTSWRSPTRTYTVNAATTDPTRSNTAAATRPGRAGRNRNPARRCATATPGNPVAGGGVACRTARRSLIGPGPPLFGSRRHATRSG